MAASSAQAQTRFPFDIPWDDASQTAVSAADLNPAPLTSAHRVGIKNGHFFDTTGRRVRFLGTNLTGSANFSRPEDAVKFAAHLHKLGINCVRLHHMDAPWASPNIFGQDRDNYTLSNAQTSPQSLDLLDSTVAALKKNGVYVNLNLHVARFAMAADGFPDAEKLPEMGKVVAYFDPQFIAMQKEYARQLLLHRNPYTGLKWADDPALAVVEINNEDTLVGQAWSGVLQAMPPRYRTTLSEGWNKFLKARYTSTAALRTAWNAPLSPAQSPNLLFNARFETNTEKWQLESQDNSGGKMSVLDVQNAPANGPTGRAMRVEIAQKPDAGWKVQLSQTGLNLKSDAGYTLSYWIRSDAARGASNYFAFDQAPWTQIGGQKGTALTKDWQFVRVAFKVGKTIPNHSRLSFALGDASDAVEIADVRLIEGAQALVPIEQTLETSTLDLPPAQGSSARQGQDWIEYLSAIEGAYVQTMRDTVRRECGFGGPITCSQLNYGGFAGVVRESASDWTDMHAYWQHPDFPGKAWDATNWRIPNTAMLDDPNGGTLLGLATARVEGKPFTVSEYNHSAPNDYASETVPTILSYAALQDWDGVFLFDWNGDRDNWNPGKIRGFFDMDSDPNKTVFLPIMARAFLSGALPVARSRTTLSVSQSELLPLAAQSQNGFWDNIPAVWKESGLDVPEALNSRLSLRVLPTRVPLKLARSSATPAQDANPNFNWKFSGAKGRLIVDSPTVKALVGRVAGQVWPLGALSVENPSSSNGWLSLVVAARDGKPIGSSNSLLVAALNRAENQNMGWNADRTSVGDKWGDGPTTLETPSATLDLQTSASNAVVWKLDATGERTVRMPLTLAKGRLRFQISPDDETPWYEVALTTPAGVKTAP